MYIYIYIIYIYVYIYIHYIYIYYIQCIYIYIRKSPANAICSARLDEGPKATHLGAFDTGPETLLLRVSI